MMAKIRPVAKAIVAGAAAACAYLAGLLADGETLADITTAEWLGLIPVIAATYGITWRVPNKTP